MWVRYKKYLSCSHLIKRFETGEKFINYYKEFVIPSLTDKPSKKLLQTKNVSAFVRLFNQEFKSTYSICGYGRLLDDVLNIKSSKSMRKKLKHSDLIDLSYANE